MGIYEIFNWVYSFETENLVCIKDLNTNKIIDVSLKKSDKGFVFRLKNPDFKILYDKNSLLSINSELFEVKINYFLTKYENLYTRICEAYMFQSVDFNNNNNNNNNTKKYHCYFSKIPSCFLVSFLKENQTDFSICVDDYKFNIKTVGISESVKHIFLHIECENSIEFKTFKNYVNTIITSIGFFSGNFYKNEEIYFQSELKDFSNRTNFFYRSSNKKYSFPKPFTKHLHELNWKFNPNSNLSRDLIDKWASFINENVFESLVKLLIDKPRIYFSIKMLFDFHNYPSISKVSLMFVVLETLCEELNKKTDHVEKELKKEEARKTLNEIKDKISPEAHNVIDDAINNIDVKLTNNAVHFEQTFISLNVCLHNEDKKVFKQRNNFLHGRIIPKNQKINNEEDFYQLEIEYNYYSWRLYMLISKLILKKISFSGYLINYPKILENFDAINSNEPYFIKLNL